jgi:hypothetical protein
MNQADTDIVEMVLNASLKEKELMAGDVGGLF